MRISSLKGKLFKPLSYFVIRCGNDFIYRKLIANDKVTLVFYHDVADKSPLPETKLFVEYKYFWQHIDEITKRYSIISISDLLSVAPLPPHPLVLSFDGYSSRYDKLAKDLSDRKIKAMFYLQSEPILSGRPHWQQQLFFILRSLRNSKLVIEIDHKIFSANLGDDPKENILVAGKLFRFMDCFDNKREIIDLIATQYGVPLREFDITYRPLTPEEVYHLSEFPGIEIGSHSHTHPNFGEIDKEQILIELKTSRELLEKWSQKDVLHFCYPEGYVSKQAIEMLKATGYVTATTTRRRPHKLYSSAEWPYLIPRFCMSNGPFYLSSREVIGVDKSWNYISKLRNYFGKSFLEGKI
jgi:peptidoglycan/xylan/chitin deacetylase (PgdA/CDA1 family)